jgi:hypothetical protein
MLTFTLSSFLAALLFVYLFMPAVWLSIISVDDALDAREAGLAVVAARMFIPIFSLLITLYLSRARVAQVILSERAVHPRIWPSSYSLGTRYV